MRKAHRVHLPSSARVMPREEPRPRLQEGGPSKRHQCPKRIAQDTYRYRHGDHQRLSRYLNSAQDIDARDHITI
ncbi:Hypothetical predicted protein [Pelobates cultripes]|uniref:Uncharacterized protein n=1 Tax=Pelobates cultripes TaxID=61616 RepID=A0AAD1WXH2_PELCU|nr:Hypothetical predicted protein [Pelobates cultripes]